MVQVQNETHQFELVGNAESSGGEGRGEEALHFEVHETRGAPPPQVLQPFLGVSRDHPL